MLLFQAIFNAWVCNFIVCLFCCYVNQQMGKDSRGRERGGCNLCECLGFEREDAKIEMNYMFHVNFMGHIWNCSPLGFFLNYCVGVLHNLWGCF